MSTQKRALAIVSVLSILMMGGALTFIYAEVQRHTNIRTYYTIIRDQETVRDDVRVTESDIQQIRECGRNQQNENDVDKCLRDFYENFTLLNGIEKAFAHLAALEKEYPQYIPSCHYISHGIGHAALQLYDNDVFAAYGTLQESPYFRNLVTCGHGFYHGVLEEATRDISDPRELGEYLRDMCANAYIRSIGHCLHGSGHAVMIQVKYDIDMMIEICEAISDIPASQFMCQTGGFMEYAQEFTDYYEFNNGKIRFPVCDSLEKKYQPACYLEQADIYENYAQDPKDYATNIGYCKAIEDELNRMACVKLFAIRSVRIARYERVSDMCSNTSTREERVMCTAIVADRIGGSMDATRKSDLYHSAVEDVCRTLSESEYPYCTSLVYYGGYRLFYTSERDLVMPNLR